MLTKDWGQSRRLERATLGASKTRGGLIALGLEAGTLKRPHLQGPGAQTLPNMGAGLGESGTTPAPQQESSTKYKQQQSTAEVGTSARGNAGTGKLRVGQEH